MGKKKKSKKAEYLVFTAFIVFGFIITVITSIIPLTLYFKANSWTEKNCIVLESKVKVFSSTNSNTSSESYSPQIKYKYLYGDYEYESDKYSFFDSRMSKKNAQNIVDSYPKGTKNVCYVDPANPKKSILNRDFSWTFLYGLGGLCAALIGIVGFYNTATGKWNKKRSK